MKKLLDSDLILILKKKVSLIQELFDLSQEQMRSSILDHVLNQKDQCIQSLEKVDELIEVWKTQHSRQLHFEEQQLLTLLKKQMLEIYEFEQQFEQQLISEQEKLKLESKSLQQNHRVKHYLSTNENSGKNFRFSR